MYQGKYLYTITIDPVNLIFKSKQEEISDTEYSRMRRTMKKLIKLDSEIYAMGTNVLATFNAEQQAKLFKALEILHYNSNNLENLIKVGSPCTIQKAEDGYITVSHTVIPEANPQRADTKRGIYWHTVQTLFGAIEVIEFSSESMCNAYLKAYKLLGIKYHDFRYGDE